MSKLLWIIPVCQVTFVKFFWPTLLIKYFLPSMSLQMPDPEPSLLASSLHSSAGRSGRSVVSHRDLSLGRGDGLPKKSNKSSQISTSLSGCALTWGHTLHYALLGFGACGRKHNPWSVPGKEHPDFWTQMASCSEKVQWGTEVLLVPPAQTQTIHRAGKKTSIPPQ